MNVERSDLEGRAARHAALGEPTRLRIVDLLALSDLSPTDLRRELGLSSNLLAHHLNLLEQVGIVHRSRSEADGRRSYVRLEPDALAGLLSTPARAVERVVFVCRANSARSQLAAALWRGRSDIPAASAGTHPAERVAPGAVATAKRHHLDLGGARPHALDEVLGERDFVVTVCDSSRELIGDRAALHWSVPDPVRSGERAAFDAAYSELARRIELLAPRLTAA